MRVAARGSALVLADVSLEVRAGEVVGLVGPNGAGKTTLIRIVGGLVEPTQGRVSICGVDALALPMEARSRLGVALADDRGLYWRLTARQNLEFFGVMNGLSASEAHARTSDMLKLVGLDDDGKLVFGYSSGMRSRLNVARALLPEPPVLVLDEPTRSMDAASQDVLWQLLRQMADAGTAVLVCSHDLERVAEQCDRIAVLIEGRLRFYGDAGEISGKGETLTTMMASFVEGGPPS